MPSKNETRARTKSKKSQNKPSLKKIAQTMLEAYAAQKPVKPFNKSDSTCIEKKIKDSLKTTPLYLLAVEVSQSFKVQGFGSMREYVQNTFTEQYPTLNRQLVAARVSMKMFGPDSIGLYSDASMQALNNLKDPELKKIKKLIEEKLGKAPSPKKVTKEFIEALLRDLGIKKEKAKKTDLEILTAQIKKTYSDNSSLTPVVKAIQTALKKDKVKTLIKLLKA
ncbi:hypothetical protein [Rheinheimera texasensis]|uniref:hypothetical protein n=1 Tax=Rheinheimera texasensis TaxID=306205 RepID=UPI0032B1D3A5